MSYFDDIWMKRGSDADLFTPTPSAVANAPAAAAPSHYGAPQGATGGQPGNQAAAMFPSHLASQLAALGSPGTHIPGYGGNASNMNIFSQVSPFAGNDAKKVKLDNIAAAQGGAAGPVSYHGSGHSQQQQIVNLGGSAPPSRYVTICNLPEGTTQTEIIGLGAKEGKITAAAVVDMKRQGYLEFEEERSAISMVNRCRNSPPIHRGNQLSVTFGSAKDMKMLGGGGSHGGVSPDVSMGMNPHGNGDERTVLRVIVEMGENQNIYSQVNLDVLHHLFSRTGFVMKIITFAKPGYPQQFQALIQYLDPKSAQTAKELFDGQNLYYGCCPLKVEYSKLTNLNVKYNNEKSRDFTRPDLPTGENTPVIPNIDQTTLALVQAGLMPAQFAGLGGAGANQFGAALNSGALGHLGLSQTPFYDPSLSLFYINLANQNSSAQGNMAMQQSMAPNALLQQLQRSHPAVAAAAALASLPSVGNQGGGVVVNNAPTNSVLLVGNLNTEKVTCDGLFTLFGVYGDVQRVKILFNKQDSALIQMSSEAQANLAIENLNEVKVYGREMRVSMSKHQLVQLPKEGQPDAGLTKDYSSSPLHRFRKQGSKNFQNIYPPSSTLHLSNIAPGVSEEQVLEAFTKKNIEVVSFRFFPNDHKMALLQCRNKEDAVIALIEAHNYQLGENHHLRVSFSKTQMSMSSIGSGANPMMNNSPSVESPGGGCDGMNGPQLSHN